MSRRVFFSFHYSRDAWRVGQVRNTWVTKQTGDASTFLDKAQWQSIERQGPRAIQNWIDDQLKGTSVTVVLIGAETATREWVNYEIRKSIADGKGMLGIYINGLKNASGLTDLKGASPFTQLRLTGYKTYDWAADQGYLNLPLWIEAAAKTAGR